MSLLPTHSTGATPPPPPSSSSQSGSTRGGDAERDVEKSREDLSEKQKRSEHHAFEDRGIFDVDDEGKQKKVKVVMERQTGKELVQEIGTGQYTIPRWSVSLLRTL